METKLAFLNQSKNESEATIADLQLKLDKLIIELSNGSLDPDYEASLVSYKTRVEKKLEYLNSDLPLLLDEIAQLELKIANAEISFTSEEQSVIDYIELTFPGVYTTFITKCLSSQCTSKREQFFALFANATSPDAQELLLNSVTGIL